jgi:hypothetical protein
VSDIFSSRNEKGAVSFICQNLHVNNTSHVVLPTLSLACSCVMSVCHIHLLGDFTGFHCFSSSNAAIIYDSFFPSLFFHVCVLCCSSCTY